MKKFNLDEYLANPNRKVVTRKGIPVKIHCTNFGSGQHIIAEIEGANRSESFTKDGSFYYGDHPSIYDLFFDTEKKEGWFNIYHCDGLGFYIRQNQPYKSKEEADEVAKANFRTFFATVKIEWEE